MNGGSGGKRSRRQSRYCHFDHYHYDHHHCYCHIVIFFNPMNIGTKHKGSCFLVCFCHQKSESQICYPALAGVQPITARIFLTYLTLTSALLLLPSFCPSQTSLTHLVRAHPFWLLTLVGFPQHTSDLKVSLPCSVWLLAVRWPGPEFASFMPPFLNSLLPGCCLVVVIVIVVVVVAAINKKQKHLCSNNNTRILCSGNNDNKKKSFRGIVWGLPRR